MKSFLCIVFFMPIALLFSSDRIFSQNSKRSYSDSLKIMPSFRFYSPDGTVFTSDSLGNKNSTVIIYFKTDCPYCGKEADIISNNINDFPTTDFVFITRSDTADVRDFVALHKLENNKRVRFLQDKEKLYYKFYTASYTPSIHIYDKNKKLKLFTEGILGKEELLKYIR